MYQGTKVCRAKELCRCAPWPCDLEIKIPFRSVSPKRMKIFGWYLVWGCIRGQRCVRQKICVDVTFDLDQWPWPQIALYCPPVLWLLISDWRFLVDIWLGYVSGDKGVSCKRIVSMWPLTLTLWPWNRNSLPVCISLPNEDFWLIFGGRMYHGTKVCQAKDVSRSHTCTLNPTLFVLTIAGVATNYR
jgi:hypothetical protein